MYLPRDFATEDPDGAWTIVEENPFGVLFDPRGPSASHIPFLVKRDADGRPIGLRGHVARANPAASLVHGEQVLAVFQGPHAYVTPRWYEHPREQVPTWNYVVTHVWGRAHALDTGAVRALLDDLCARFDGTDGFRTDWLTPALRNELLAEIVGFEVEASRIEAKLKLSQNRSAEDRRRVMEGLEARGGPDDRAVVEWMRRLLR